MDDTSETKTFPLKKPLRLGDLTYAELTARELSIGEWDKATAAKSGFAADIAVIALSAGVAPAIIEKLPTSDFRKIRAYVMGFWNDGQSPGSEP